MKLPWSGKRSSEPRVVVVTGAGSGIGRATALAFARAGDRVHAVDVAEAGLESLRAEAPEVATHRVDCSQEVALRALAAEVEGREGRVDVLHNNAGIGHAGSILTTSTADWERVLGINLWGTIHGTRAFVPGMVARGSGHVINTASGLGLLPLPSVVPYCTSKFAVVGFSQALALELAPHGVQVTVICPGVIRTPIVSAAALDPEVAARREALAQTFLERGASPERVAAEVLAASRGRSSLRTCPRSHVDPLRWLHALSPRAYAAVAQRVWRVASS